MTDDAGARIRELARLSAERWDSEAGRRDMARRAREARRSAVIDMSGEAVGARIRELAELSRLCAELAEAGAGPRDAG